MERKNKSILLPVRCIVFLMLFLIGSRIVNRDLSEISNWWSTVATIINALLLPLTFLLCWHYYKKRNPVPIMVGHAIIDLATVIQIIITSFVPGFYKMMCEM